MKSREDQLRAPGGHTRPGVILALACAAQFMVILDLVVVNVALPTMQRHLRLSSSDLQWVVITYGLTFGGFLLLGGRAADLLGRRNVLVAGLTMFTAGSLAAGLAGSLAPLLVARAVQGFGAAMAAPAALSILTGTFAEGPARNKALGIFGGAAGSAACLGLVVSGVLRRAEKTAASARPQEPEPEPHCVRHDVTTDLAVVRPE
jgi:MFS family permease